MTKIAALLILLLHTSVLGAPGDEGGVTRYTYDPETGERTLEETPDGARTVTEVDARGNAVAVTTADGGRTEVEYAGYLPVRVRDPRGGEWRFEWSAGKRLVRQVTPTGEATRYAWREGLLRELTSASGARTALAYDEAKNLSAVTHPSGGESRFKHDALGRVVKSVDVRGGAVRVAYDAEGRALEVSSPLGLLQRMAYDAEGNLLEAVDATRQVRLAYGGFHWVVAREEAGAKLGFRYDTAHFTHRDR